MTRSLAIGGLAVLAVSAGFSFLSRFFIFGTGYLERPLLPFVTLFTAGSLVLLWVFRNVSSPRPQPAGARGRLLWILTVSFLARGVLFFSTPIQETDPYRYLWDGNAVLHGVNPYRYAPSEAVGQAPPFSPGETAWRDSIRPEEARRVFERIGYPEVRTVYPPLAQGLFALAQGLTPWSLLGWRLLVLLADLAGLALIVGILSRARLPVEWAILYGWSPLILKEFGNSLHMDVFVVLSLCGMLHALQRGRPRLAFAALAAGALVKLAPLILLPPLFGWVWRDRPGKALRGLGWAMALMGAGYLPFLDAGARVFEGFTAFTVHWRVNESFYGFWRALGLPRGALWGLIAAASIGCALRWARRPTVSQDLRPFWRGSLMLLAGSFLLLPMGNPWYFTWAVPFMVLVPARTLIWLSGALGLYYLDFYFMYRGNPGGFGWARLVEYGSVAMVAAWELWQWRQSQLFSRSSMSAISSAALSRT